MLPLINFSVVFAGLVSAAVDLGKSAVDLGKSALDAAGDTYELGKAIATGEINLFNTLVEKLFSVVDFMANQVIEGILGIAGLVFTYGTRYFLFFENPANVDALNQYWVDTLPLYAGILLFGFMTYYPTMMLLADEEKADIERIVERIILSAFILIISRELLAFFINLTHTIAFGILPQDFSFHVVFASFEAINAAASGILLTYAVMYVNISIGTVLISSAVLFYLILAMRMLVIYVMYAMFPVIIALWVFDVGPAKYGKTFADFSFKITGVLLVMGIVVAATLTVGISVANPSNSAGVDFASDYNPDESGTVVLSTDRLGPDPSPSEGTGGSFDTRSIAEILFTVFMYVGTMWLIMALFLSMGGMVLSAGAASPGGMGGTHGSAKSSARSPTSHHPAASSNPDEGIWGGRYGEATSGTSYTQKMDDGRIAIANPAGGGVIVNPDAPMSVPDASSQFDGVGDQRFQTFTPEENPLADDDAAPNPFQDPEPVQWGDRASNIGNTIRKKASDALGAAKDESDVASAAAAASGNAAAKTAEVAGSAGSAATDAASATANAAGNATAEAAKSGAERVNESEYVDRDVTSDVESAIETASEAKDTAVSMKESFGETASDFIGGVRGAADTHLTSGKDSSLLSTLSEAKQQYSTFGRQKMSSYMNGLDKASNKFQNTRVGGFTVQEAGRFGSLMRRAGKSSYSVWKKPSIETSVMEAKRVWLESEAHKVLGNRVPGMRHTPVDKEHAMKEGYGAYELGREYGNKDKFVNYPQSPLGEQEKGSVSVGSGRYPPDEVPRTEDQLIEQNMNQAESVLNDSPDVTPTTDKPPYGVPDYYRGRDPDIVRQQDGFGADPVVDGINGAHHRVRANSAKEVADTVSFGGYDEINVNEVYGEINHQMQHLESVIDDYSADLDMSREDIAAMIEYQGEMGVPADMAVKRTAEMAINRAAGPIDKFNTSNELLEEFGVESIPESLATDTPIRRINLDQEGVNTSSVGDMWRVERNDGSIVYEQDGVNMAGVNAVQTEAVMSQLGIDVPEHHFDPVNGVLRVEGLQGDTLAEVMNGNSSLDPSDVDIDSLVDSYASMGITGHNDVNSSNLVVQDDGSVVPINFDTAGGNVTDTQPLSIEKAEEVADQLGADVSKYDVKQRMKQMSKEFVNSDDITSEKIAKKLPDADADPDEMLVDHYTDGKSPQQLSRELKNKRKQGIEQANEVVGGIHTIANGEADWQHNSPRPTGSRTHNLQPRQTTDNSPDTSPSSDQTRPFNTSDPANETGANRNQHRNSFGTSPTSSGGESGDSTSNVDPSSSTPTPSNVSDTRADNTPDIDSISDSTNREVNDEVKDYDLESSTPTRRESYDDRPNEVNSRPLRGSNPSNSTGSSDSPYSSRSSSSSSSSSRTYRSGESQSGSPDSVSSTREERLSDNQTTSPKESNSSIEDDVKDYDLQSSTPGPSSGQESNDGIDSMTTDKGIHAQVEDTMDAYTSDLDERHL